jgi:hypothetical protein
MQKPIQLLINKLLIKLLNTTLISWIWPQSQGALFKVQPILKVNFLKQRWIWTETGNLITAELYQRKERRQAQFLLHMMIVLGHFRISTKCKRKHIDLINRQRQAISNRQKNKKVFWTSKQVNTTSSMQEMRLQKLLRDVPWQQYIAEIVKVSILYLILHISPEWLRRITIQTIREQLQQITRSSEEQMDPSQIGSII